ncbi:unnamed protein product [Amoebophrya sp. A25]|nr:unnamed protein product [Amoebophrya sp. A25]|eukprot:GSA25T00017123001.1
MSGLAGLLSATGGDPSSGASLLSMAEQSTKSSPPPPPASATAATAAPTRTGPSESSVALQAGQKDLQNQVESLADRFSIAAVPVQRKGVECSLKCFDTHGEKYKDIGACVQKCQKPFEELSAATNREFQGNAESRVVAKLYGQFRSANRGHSLWPTGTA